MKVTFLGHSCFLVETNISSLLFDPFITSNPLAKDINIESIRANYILVSHGHIDHIEDLERIYLQQDKVTLISSVEIINHYIKKIGIKRYHPMNPGGKWKFDFGTVHAVKEAHSNSLPDSTYGGIAMGYVVHADNKTFYFAGDTGLHTDMKLIKEFHNVDFAFFPIGGNFTMDIDQAVVAADYVGTNNIIAMHYDTNIMIKINHKTALETAEKCKKNLIFLNIEQTIEI